MKEQLDERLLFDEEDLPYAIWKDKQAPKSLRIVYTTFFAFIKRFVINLCYSVIILFILAFACPQFLLRWLQILPGGQIEYAYKHFPLRSDVHWMTFPGDPDYWSNTLYMGEASAESDSAWNQLIRRHGFRALDEEAERLNLTSSLPLEQGGVSASLGVDHNLHCLRHFKQWYFRDYYYRNKTAQDLAWLEGHTLHCLETLRKSVMCFPDLNLSPYYMEPEQHHHPTHISTWGKRQCVDYERLNNALDGRRYSRSEYGEDVNRLLDAANRN